MNATRLGTAVGILGGGQLARMLAESAYRLGLEPRVLAASAQDPAARLCPDSVYGSWNDPVILRRLFSQVELVIFENEFIPCEEIEIAARGLPVRFAPSLESIFQLQDKLRQKEILSKLGIPSAPYEVLPRAEAPARWLEWVSERFEGRFVLKWAQLGYDGKGTWISPEPGQTPKTSALDFCNVAIQKRVPLYAEAKVAFRRELAVVASHSITGDFAAYPLVVSRQSGGICRTVLGPATALGVDAKLEKLAHDFARKLARGLPLHGSFALEMFETPSGELWVNELAPRVHNTGHYTQDASRTSQFENHWRACLGLPLGSTESAPGFAMLNLLGDKRIEREPGETLDGPIPTPEMHVHWYGKQGVRAGRKLGHLNAAVSDPSDVDALVTRLEKCEQDWIERNSQ